MNIRAVIFDVYGTLMEVRPTPPEARQPAWEALCRRFLGGPCSLSFEEFTNRSRDLIRAQHTLARSRGVPHPEISWPQVVAAVFPEWHRLPAARCQQFPREVMGIERELSMAPEVIRFLRECVNRRLSLGIASNAQAYTLFELDSLLEPHGLERSMFSSDLCFWSFENGFSKPDPHVFQLLNARLACRGIVPGEILLVGDRADNDIAPATAFGWHTWLLAPSPGSGGGDWRALTEKLWGSNLSSL